MMPGLRAPAGQTGHQFLREAGRAVQGNVRGIKIGIRGDIGDDAGDYRDRTRSNRTYPGLTLLVVLVFLVVLAFPVLKLPGINPQVQQSRHLLSGFGGWEPGQ